MRIKIADQITKNTVINPSVKGLKIRVFKIKTQDPLVCLLDVMYGVWSHYVNYISMNYVPKNLYETQYKIEVYKTPVLKG